MSLMQGRGAGRSNREKPFISTHLRVGSSAESEGPRCVSGTWAKAAAECDCHTGVTGAEPRQTGWHWWVPLPRPCCCVGTAELRETIPMDGVPQLGQAAPSPRSQSSDPSPSLAALELCPLVAAVSLPWAGCISLEAVGQTSCWGLVPVRAGSCLLLCTVLGSGFGDSCVPRMSC